MGTDRTESPLKSDPLTLTWTSIENVSAATRGHAAITKKKSPVGDGTLEAVSFALYALAGLNVFAAIARVGMIGKPRKRVTRSDAIVSVVYCAAVATILVIAAIRLG